MKKAISLFIALTVITGILVSCGIDIEEDNATLENTVTPDNESTDSDNETDDSVEETTASEFETTTTQEIETTIVTTATTEQVTEEISITQNNNISYDVGTGGDTLTIACWNADDIPYLIAEWKGLEYDTIQADLEAGKVDNIDFIVFNVNGGQASERYDAMFNAGDDLDVYFFEDYWAWKYVNDDSKTLPLEKLGFTDSDFANIYSYTDNIAKDKNGLRKGVAYNACPGGFAYRADLAEKYLGIESPEEMQNIIGNWADFTDTAITISEKSDGSVALADSIGGIWQAYSRSRINPWVSDSELNIDDSFCSNFLNISKNLWDNNGVSHSYQWYPSWTDSGVSGNTMGYFVSTWGLDGFLLDASGGVYGEQYGKWAFCRGPSPYHWGGTWICVNPATDNGNEVHDFIYSAVVDKTSMESYALKKPDFVNNRIIMNEIISYDAVLNADAEFNFADGQNIYSVFAGVAESLYYDNIATPYDSIIESDLLFVAQNEYCEGGSSYDETISAFKDIVQEHIPDITVN